MSTNYSSEGDVDDEMLINDYESLSTEIKKNSNLTKIYAVGRRLFIGHWYRNEIEAERHYSGAWFLLPIGSIFITSLIILLMVLFNRCPQMIGAIVTTILGIIIILLIFLLIGDKIIYT